MATLDYSPTSDARSYHIIADNFAHGNGIADVFPQVSTHATAFRPAGFPLLLGAVYRVLGASVGVGRLTNLVIGVVVVLLVERVVARIGGTTAGVTAAALVALYPPLVVNDVTILAESLSLLFLLVIVVALANGQWQLAGIETGLLVISRNSAQLLVPVLAILVACWFGWRRALAFSALAALVIVPMLVRNQLQLGGVVLTTSNGFNLAASYSNEAHDTDGFVDAAFDPRFSDTRLLQFDEIAWDRALRARGLDGLRAHPSDVLYVSQRNALEYFELTPAKNEPAEIIDGRNIDVRDATLPLFYFVTTLGLVGLWRARRHRATVLMLTVAVYFSVVSIVSVTAPRLRGPFDLACCMGVGLLVGQLVGSTGAGPRRSSSSSSA
jgi:hypothetical protein